MEKITVYTCITGGYDTLMQPCPPPDGFEFVCFVRKGAGLQGRIGAWEIREAEWDCDDNTLLARHQKLNPHEVLPADTVWSLWVDGNIRIARPDIYGICRDLQTRDVKYAGIRHPSKKLNWLQRKLKFGLNRPQERALRRLIANTRRHSHSGLTALRRR